jgi:hypothetical protein
MKNLELDCDGFVSGGRARAWQRANDNNGLLNYARALRKNESDEFKASGTYNKLKVLLQDILNEEKEKIEKIFAVDDADAAFEARKRVELGEMDFTGATLRTGVDVNERRIDFGKTLDDVTPDMIAARAAMTAH